MICGSTNEIVIPLYNCVHVCNELIIRLRVHEAVYVSERKTVHLPDVPEERCPEFFPDRLSLSVERQVGSSFRRSDTRRKILNRELVNSERRCGIPLRRAHDPRRGTVCWAGSVARRWNIVVANLVSVFVSLFDVT